MNNETIGGFAILIIEKVSSTGLVKNYIEEKLLIHRYVTG